MYLRNKYFPLATPPRLPVMDNLAMRFDAAYGVKKDGAAVYGWQDVSGQGYDMLKYENGADVASTTADAAFANFPTVNFNAGDSLRLHTSAAKFTSVGSYSVFVVGRLTGGTSERLVSSFDNNWLIGWWQNTQDGFYGGGGWVVTATATAPASPTTTATTAVKLYTATVSSANFGAMATNGVQMTTTGTAAALAMSWLQLGGGNAGGVGAGEESTGSIAELLVYRAALGAADRNAIEAYLRAKYKITSTMGATLPVTAGLRLRVDAAVGVTMSGSEIATWNDQSGAGNHFTKFENGSAT